MGQFTGEADCQLTNVVELGVLHTEAPAAEYLPDSQGTGYEVLVEHAKPARQILHIGAKLVLASATW
jgi:hypothetical protein